MARSSLIASSFTTRISAHITCVVKFKMAARFAEPTKVEIVALFENATPENTKKATEYGVKILNGKFTKMKKNFKEL